MTIDPRVSSPKPFSIVAIFVLMVSAVCTSAQIPKAPSKKPADPPASTPATPPATADKKNTGAMQNAQSNPLYKGDKMEGTNPLYQGRDSNAKSNAPTTGATTTHDVVEYKDGEDQTTRSRPGNKKTAKTVSPVGPPSTPNKVADYKDGEDGTTQTRPTKPK